MNQFNLIGRVTKDVECRYTTGQNPTAVAEFNLAVNRNKDEADFPRVTVFGKTAENCEKYIGKGSQVAVTGHIQTGSYEGKDGKIIYFTNLIADRVEFLSSKSAGSNEPTEKAPEPPTGFSQVDDDIPF